MTRVFFLFFLLAISAVSRGQNPDLGLNGKITWLSDTEIRVEYDWTADSQLLDWVTTKGSRLIRDTGSLVITGGSASVSSMVWKQLVRCSRIYAENAEAINASAAHLNFITNVLDWDGYEFNPPGIIGLIYKENGNVWLENGTTADLGGPTAELGTPYTIDINISATGITAISSSDSIMYSHMLVTTPGMKRQVAVGGWGGDTRWGKLIIEGYVSSERIPADMINFRTAGSSFAPVIEVTGNPLIEWIFDDSTTSASAAPVKNYGTPGYRNNMLRVTPWSALIGVNTGYTAEDGGYGDFDIIDGQNVSGIDNIGLAGSSLQYLCAAGNPLTSLDLRGFRSLEFLELLGCNMLQMVRLDTHPVLERICFENCSLDSLDLSGCPGLLDLRASRNNYTVINWGSTGNEIWHLCVRSNPQLIQNLPAMEQFPALRELLNWDANQTGEFICHNPLIRRIDAYDNLYTGADVSGCTELRELSLSGSKLATLDISDATMLDYVRLRNCGLTTSQVDYVLSNLDASGRTDGYLEIDENEGPSQDGFATVASLRNKGWTVYTEPVTGIDDIEDNDDIRVTVAGSVMRVLLNERFISWNVELYNAQGKVIVGRVADKDMVEFDISSLSAGIYILGVSWKNQRKTVKVALNTSSH